MGRAVIDWDERYAARARRMAASEIRELLKLLDQPDIISFAGGIPDPALFPVAEIASSYADVLSQPASAGAGLQYSVSEGYLPLRQWIAAYMGRLGVACGALRRTSVRPSPSTSPALATDLPAASSSPGPSIRKPSTASRTARSTVVVVERPKTT